jgi:molybdenum cofactor cytidylyltransferase
MAAVGAIILAAGGSSRFGTPKQLARLRGETLVGRAVAAAIGGGCAPVIVVIGANGKEVAGAVANRIPIVVENRDWPNGIGTSIGVGVRQLVERDPDVGAALLMVCDQPLVTTDTVNNLITQRKRTGKAIVASNYSNTAGVPAVFDRSCFQELLNLQDDTGAKPIIMKDPARVECVPFPEGALDIDRVEDLTTYVAGRAKPSK